MGREGDGAASHESSKPYEEAREALIRRMATIDGEHSLQEFVALLTSAQGVGALVHNARSRGPPLRVVLYLRSLQDGAAISPRNLGDSINVPQLVISQKTAWLPCRNSKQQDLTCISLADIKGIVVGRHTKDFQRTGRYLRGIGEPLLDMEDLDSRCFSLIISKTTVDSKDVDNNTTSMDIEIPLSQGGPARRDRLVLGLSTYVGVDILREPPKYLTSSMHKPGFTEHLHRIMYGRLMTVFLATCIFASVTIMACLSPLLEVDPDLMVQYASEVEIANSLNTCIRWVFTFEAISKIVSFESITFYLRDPWNALDFVVVVGDWLSDAVALLSVSSSGDGVSFTALRALRALRVLRTFKMLEGIREIVDTFIRTLVAVVQGIMIYFYFVGIFAVCAFEFWQSSLNAKCMLPSGAAIVPALYCRLDFADNSTCPAPATCQGISTVSKGQGFHDFGNALTTMYSMSVRAGIGSYVHNLLSVSPSPVASFFTIAFFIIFSLFVSGMVFATFIAIIRHTFATTRRHAIERRRRLTVTRQRQSAIVAPADMTRRRTRASQAFQSLRDLPKQHLKRRPPLIPLAGAIVDSPFFEGFVSFVILLNCVSFAFGYYGQPTAEADVLDTIEISFTCIFAGELIIKVLGLGGFRAYCASPWNVFDFIIVVSSLVGVFAESFVNLSLLRLLRLLRVVRLLRRNPDIVRILSALLSSFPQLGNLVLFCGLVFSVFAIMGMQLYGAKLGLPSEEELVNSTFAAVYRPPRANFDTFPNALLSLFQMMTGGAQWAIYYNILASSMATSAPFFFLTFGVFSTFIILNFMVVIIMSNFALSAEALRKLRADREDVALRAISLREKQQAKSLHNIKAAEKVWINSPLQDDDISEKIENKNVFGEALDHQNSKGCWDTLIARWVPETRRDFALLLLPPESVFRLKMQMFSEHVILQGTVLFAVAASSVLLTLEAPETQDSLGSSMLKMIAAMDIVFLVVFTLEFLVKIIAHGLFIPREAYLRSGWNWLDFVVLIVSFVSLGGGAGNTGKMLRIGRILRPLRMINRNEGLKVIVDAVLRAVQPVSYTAALLLVYFFTFGMVGMDSYMGLFWRCNDSNVAGRGQCIGHYIDSSSGMLRPRVWSNPAFSFDSIGDAFSVLVETVSLKAWPEKLYVLMDTTELGVQPSRDASPGNSLYLVVFIYFGSFFMMKLFVGVIVGTFRKFSGTLLLTPDQLEWLEMKRVMAHISPRLSAPPQGLRKRCFDAYISNRLQRMTAAYVLLHLVYVFAWESASPGNVTSVERVGHGILLTVAILLQGAQVWGAGLVNVYTRRAYNIRTRRLYRRLHKSKSFTALMLLACVILPPCTNISIRLLVAIKALNFSHLLKIVSAMSPTMENVLNVLWSCLVPMLNVTLVFFMVIFVYAILGMQLFAEVRSGEVMGVSASFANFPKALLTMFEITAGDNWITIMRECGIAEPKCTSGEDCGSYVGSRVFFYSFFFICFGAFLNLYAATIIDAYESKLKSHTIRWDFTEAQLDKFQEVWGQVDPRSTGRISTKLFRTLFFDLGVPFVYGKNEEFSERDKIVQYNQARLEIFDAEIVASGFPCALPNGQVAEAHDNESSVSFFEVLRVVVLINVDKESLSTLERVERCRKERLILGMLAAMSIQSWYRGVMHRRILRAMVHASQSQAGANDDNIRQSYAVLYSKELSIHHPVIGVLRSRRPSQHDEVNVLAVRTLMNTDTTSPMPGSGRAGSARMSLDALIEEQETQQQLSNIPRRHSLQIEALFAHRATYESSQDLNLTAEEVKATFAKTKPGTF